MPWQVRIEPTASANIDRVLEHLKLDEGALAIEKPAAQIATREQFKLAVWLASVVARRLPGPKIAGTLGGHTNATGSVAPPAGAMADRLTIDLYSVRFVGD
jgi:hypothetical protein